VRLHQRDSAVDLTTEVLEDLLDVVGNLLDLVESITAEDRLDAVEDP
jgi:hypothetical protein